MQKIYNWTLYAAIVICVGLVLGLVVSIALPTAIDSNAIVLSQVGLLVFFLLISLAFYFLDKNRQLRLPAFLSGKKVNMVLQAEFILFLILFAGGFYFYPYAPIKKSDGKFLDKAGIRYTYQQFNRFQKWETVYLLLSSVLILQVIVLAPLYDKDSKKWKFEN